MKRKWYLNSESNPPAYLHDIEHSGNGISRKFSDTAFWSTYDHNAEAWIDALQALDKDDDFEPLLSLATSGPMPPNVVVHFRDLFQRKRLTGRKRGTPATPSYDRTIAEALLDLAHEDIRDLVQQGSLTEDAIVSVARERGVSAGTLADSFQGKRGSSNRMKRRRAHRPPSNTA